MPIFRHIFFIDNIIRILRRNIASIALLLTTFSAHSSIVTSLRPLGFIAAAIADGVITVEVVLPDGASPHDYALRPSDVMRVKQATLLVWVGPKLESFLAGPASMILADKRITLTDIPAITPLLMKNKEKLNDDLDHIYEQPSNAREQVSNNMHLWLSPEIARHTAAAIHDRLILLMPEKKKQLNDNLQRFTTILINNDQVISKMLAPMKDKGYYVFHDAYGYFEEYYGLTPLGSFTINPEVQPSAQALYKIGNQLVQQKATCIFTEPQFSQVIINTVARGVDVYIGILDPLGSGIALNKDSYPIFLSQLTYQYLNCLNKNNM